MIISAMQPYFFPSIHYFQLIKCSDIFVILDNVNYINRGFINRNYLINSQNNQRETFNILLKNKSQNKLINEIQILDCDKFLNKIKNNYNKNQNFTEIYNNLLIKKVFSKQPTMLVDLLTNTILEVCDILKIRTKIILASKLKHLKEKGQNRIINIVKELEGTKYVNFIGGSNLYDEELFRENNIELIFLKSKLQDIKLKNSDFYLTNVSILEILMNFKLNFILNTYLSEFNLQKI
jgi:hypothetical protein